MKGGTVSVATQLVDGMENNDFSAVKRNTFGCRFGNVRNLGAMESKGKGRQLKNIMEFK